jgi:hypothetical protein
MLFGRGPEPVEFVEFGGQLRRGVAIVKTSFVYSAQLIGPGRYPNEMRARNITRFLTADYKPISTLPRQRYPAISASSPAAHLAWY